MSDEERLYRCQVCGREFDQDDVLPASLLHEAVVETIRKDYPNWSEEGYICYQDLNHYRTLHVKGALETERGELSELEHEVLHSMQQQEILSRDINREFEEDLTLGERLADRVAEFGGSWRFIIIFSVFLGIWIALNSFLIFGRPWDPYPYIFLNLVLACVTALQAPVIMMSQNRLEVKDRLRAENDYRVNLKAELEIRSLHAKMDLLVSHQWQRLLEIQEIQTEMMEELFRDGQKPCR